MSTENQNSSQSPTQPQAQPETLAAPESQTQQMAQPIQAPAANRSTHVKAANRSSLLLVLAVSLVTSAASVATYDHFFAQKVVAVDIKSFIEDKKADFVAGRLDEAGMKREMDKLEATVAAIPKNKAVLMGDLVVKNVQIIKP